MVWGTGPGGPPAPALPSCVALGMSQQPGLLRADDCMGLREDELPLFAKGPHRGHSSSLAQSPGSPDPPDWTLVTQQWEGATHFHGDQGLRFLFWGRGQWGTLGLTLCHPGAPAHWAWSP